MKARILITATAAVAAFGFGIFAGISNRSQNNKEEDFSEYAGIAYADHVSFIVQGYQTKWSEALPDELGLSLVYCYCSPFAGFVEKDINGDGINELIMGECFEEGPTIVYDLFSYNPENGNLYHVLSGGERDRFFILEDGTIVEEGSNSAEDSFIKAFGMKDGKLLECNRAVDRSEYLRIELDKFINYAGSGE